MDTQTISRDSFIVSPTSYIYYTGPITNNTNKSASLLNQRMANNTDFSAPLATAAVAATETEHTSNLSTSEWAHFCDLVLSWQNIFLITIFCVLIVITVLGNTLVILAILTTRRLRTVTNCFVMSLAVADFLVGIFVMPPAVAAHLVGSWRLGWVLCDIWISLDILLSTASILSLCAISVDRYLAVTKPLKYSHKRRSKRLALLMILFAWLMALAITCPPMFGWYEPGRRDRNECRYNQNKGYVIYSAIGSFFLPMIVMVYVYARISCVVASRHDKMPAISVHNKRLRRYTVSTDSEAHFFELKRDNNIGERRFSNQSDINELSKVMISDVENGRPFASAPLANSEQGNRYEMARPVSWKSPPDALFQYSPIANWQARGSHPQQQQLKSEAKCIILLRRERKTTRTLSIVMGGFIICWMPFFIYYLITPFLEPRQVSRTVTNVLTWLGWLNSAINPFIYAFYSFDFRVAFWRLICHRLCSNTLRPQTPNATTSMRL